MNERMMRLYRLAWVPCTETDPSNNMQYETTCFSADKFSELIVRECASIANSIGEHGCVASEEMLTHFGIEMTSS